MTGTAAGALWLRALPTPGARAPRTRLRRWVEEYTTWGRQPGSAPSPRDFKLEHTGAPGRLPVGVQDSATDVVVDAPLSDGRAGHMERIVAGPRPSLTESREAVDGRRAGLLFGPGRRGCLADGPRDRSARVELRVSSTCGLRRAVMTAVRDTS